jgi:hypothetical protein
MDVSPIFTFHQSARPSSPSCATVYLRGYTVNLTGIETLPLNDTSKIMELGIHGGLLTGLMPVLHALARRPKLLSCFPLGRDHARFPGMVLCYAPSLQSLVLANGTCTFSIKVLDTPRTTLNSLESAAIIRDVIRRNKTIDTLDLSRKTCEIMNATLLIASQVGWATTQH